VSHDDAAVVREAAAGSCGKVTLGFNLRSHRLVRRARALVAGGVVGPVELVQASWTCGFHLGGEWPTWRSDRDRGGGAVHEIAVHHLDLLRYLLADEFHSITAQAASGEVVDQRVVLTARMRSGTLASLSVSQRTADGNDVAICGPRGIVSFSCYRADSMRTRGIALLAGGLRARLHERAAWLRELPAAIGVARGGGDFRLSYAEHWRRFADSIRTGVPVPATIEDGERALAAVRAALASAETGTRVEIAA
jgi:myo-inositol 2-dehydrogenase/D-chiro-inositol 1-dehydrogenase